MGNNAITPQQLEALIQYAAKRLNMSPQQLAGTVQTKGLEGLSAHLSPEDAAKLQGKQPDRAQAEQLLRSPQVQELLRQLTGGSSHE